MKLSIHQKSTTTRTAGSFDLPAAGGFTAKGGKRQGREEPQSLRVKPGAKHPVWKTQSNDSSPGVAIADATEHPDDRPGSRNPQRGFCDAVDLGMLDYRTAWQLQTDLVSARIEGAIGDDIVLFLEHPPVFTLGRRGGLDHLLVSETFLKASGIPIVQVERGGFITFHGPGQLIAYPVMDLHAGRLGVVEYVAALEEIMQRTVAAWGIDARVNPANRGIWVGHKKMGSIGIALRKGISFHGLALNVNLDLTPFSWIQPCGLQGVEMTSMKQELDRELPMDEVRNAVMHHFEMVFGVRLANKSAPELQNRLKIQRHTQKTVGL